MPPPVPAASASRRVAVRSIRRGGAQGEQAADIDEPAVGQRGADNQPVTRTWGLSCASRQLLTEVAAAIPTSVTGSEFGRIPVWVVFVG
jgi:hypothetical protein